MANLDGVPQSALALGSRPSPTAEAVVVPFRQANRRFGVSRQQRAKMPKPLAIESKSR